MRKFNLSVLLILTVSAVFGQANYLITLKADTLKGELRILSYDQLDRVQVSIDGKKRIYTALDILVLQLDNELYKPVQLEKSIRMMKVIRSGYLSLYGFKLDNQTSYEGRYLVKMDGTSMEMPNIGFKKIMASYMEDCAELSEKLKTGDVGKRNIEEIVDQYNACLTKEKPAPVPPAAAPESPAQTKQLEAIQQLIAKIKTMEFSTRQDALDILSDIESKVSRNENVANYQLEGLRSTLKEQTTITQDLDVLIELFKK